MELNRNHYLIAGIIVLLLGLQLRLVQSYTLNESTTRFVAARMGEADPGPTATFNQLMVGASPRRSIRPPEWLGWLGMSIGSVLVLHSLGMKKPEG
jgi:hypothetical protein